jgi:hypothetical protein
MGVVLEYLWPGRRQKYATMIAMRVTQWFGVPFAADIVQRDGGIDQTAIEEHPAGMSRGVFPTL